MDEILSPRLLSEFQTYLHANLGLNFSSRHEKELKRKLLAVTKEFGHKDPENFVSWLNETPATRTMIEKLALHLSVGETFFFREPKSFDYLEKVYLPGLIRERNTGGRYLRIWSAGVASGEEIYSIAILLRQLIPNLKSWNITLLATDINPHLLEKARNGVYSKWSFRNHKFPIEGNFIATGDNKYRISPSISGMVTFSWLNLAEPVYPSAATNTLDIDIIFCRNVMIYFSGDTIAKVTDRFYNSLTRGGILIVSPADMTPFISGKFSRTSYQGYTIYHKNSEKAETAPEPRFLQMAGPTVLLTAVSNYPEPVSAFDAATITAGTDNQQLLNLSEVPAGSERNTEKILGTNQADLREEQLRKARELANQGKYDESALICSELLKNNKSDHRVHYLMATIYSEKGTVNEAIASLNKVLYLEKDFPMAHYQLGKLLTVQSGRDAALKHYRYLQKILLDKDPEVMIPESGGLTSAKFLELINADLPGK